MAQPGSGAGGLMVEGWTEFRRGEMEDIPLPDESVDVAISNGVLNLSARKSRAPAEHQDHVAAG
jgi:ubiquinone/menaquinone biosynthesis C-methylase UbiE